MASFKLTRNSSSSLSRSPTIQSGIDSLSCLEEGIISSGSSRIDRIWQEELARKHSAESSLHIRTESPHSHRHGIEIHEENVSPDHEGVRPNHESGRPIHIDVHPNHEDGRSSRENARPNQENFRSNHPRIIPIWVHTQRFKPRILLPIVVVIIFPCVYFYAHSSPHHGHSNHLPLPFDGDGFDYFALVFFFSAVLISIRIAYPRLNIMYRIRSMFSQQQRRCFSIWWLKPVTSFLVSDKTDKRMYERTSSVTWTIGSKGTSIRDGKMNDKLKNAREGVQVYSNGDVYEGEFHQGRCSGSGVYYFYMSGRYEGDWVDGKYDGYGVETWARGSRYRGQYRQGLREGYGVYRFYTGDVFSGEWSNGQSHGCGVQTCEDGSRYVGEFKWGVKHGHGYYHFRNGDTYAGEYFADKMHGYGVYQFSNGHRYEGAWHEGKRRGLGMYTFRNGEIQAGYWHAGMLQTPSTQNPGQGAAVAVSHSKVLHAVQEARRAASKAYEVPHVDDRVNKAVAAANRAANAARVAAVKAVQNKISGPASPP